MKRLRTVAAVVLSTVIACSLVSTGHAQQPQPAGGSRPAGTLQPAEPILKITVVLSRVNGEKKIANLPFVLLVTPNGGPTTVQMSSQVPIPITTVNDGKSVSSYQYQNIGTNMNVQASPLEGGAYNISLSVNVSQELAPAEGFSTGRTQSFTSSTRITLKDGGSIQYNAATDKMTGDLVKVDVTLNVIK